MLRISIIIIEDKKVSADNKQQIVNYIVHCIESVSFITSSPFFS